MLEQYGFAVQDLRALPSNADVAHWFAQVKANIERHFPYGATDALEELRVMAGNMTASLMADKVSAYSIIRRYQPSTASRATSASSVPHAASCPAPRTPNAGDAP